MSHMTTFLNAPDPRKEQAGFGKFEKLKAYSEAVQAGFAE